MNKNKTLALLGLLVLASMVLSACGGASTEVIGGETMGFDYVSPALQTVVVGSTLGAGIFWLILSLVIGLVVAGGLYLFLRSNQMSRSATTISSVVAFLVLFGSIFGTAYYKASYVEIGANQVGVLLRQGRAIDEVQPGGHFMTGFLEKMVIYPSTVNTFTTVSDPQARGSEQYRTFLMGIVTSDNVNGDVAFQVQFRVDPTKAAHLYSSYGSLENAIQQLIKGPALGEVKDRMTGKTAEEIIRDFGTFSPEVRETIEQKMAEGGLIMTDFDFRLPDFGEWQEARNQAQLNLQLAEAEKNRQNLVEAEQANLRREAEGAKERALILAQQQAEAAVISAQGAADSKKLDADAQAYATLAAAEAEAEGNKLVAESLTPELIQYLQVMQWDGAYPQTLLSPDGNFIYQIPR